ncbi:hypothetical protein ACHAXN_007947 [Cyclotella atomus]
MPTQITTSSPPPAPTSLSLPLPTTPSLKPIHLKMMDAVIKHRLSQIFQLGLHGEYLHKFASLLLSNCSAALHGEYAGYQLTIEDFDNGCVNVDKVARHYIALIYSSVDERLSGKQRLLAVKSVRVASGLLKEVLGRMERGESLDGLSVDNLDDDEDAGEKSEKTRKRRSDVRDEGGRKKSKNDRGDTSENSHDGSNAVFGRDGDVSHNAAAKETADTARAEQQRRTNDPNNSSIPKMCSINQKSTATEAINNHRTSLEKDANETFDKTASRGESPSSDMSVSIASIASKRRDQVVNRSTAMSASNMSVSDLSIGKTSTSAVTAQVANAQSVVNIVQASATLSQVQPMTTEQLSSNSIGNVVSNKTASAQQNGNSSRIQKPASEPVTQLLRESNKASFVPGRTAVTEKSTPAAAAAVDKPVAAVQTTTLIAQPESASHGKATAPAQDANMSTEGCVSFAVSFAPKEKEINNPNVSADAHTQNTQAAAADVEKNTGPTARDINNTTFNSGKSKSRWGPSATDVEKNTGSTVSDSNNTTFYSGDSRSIFGPLRHVFGNNLSLANQDSSGNVSGTGSSTAADSAPISNTDDKETTSAATNSSSQQKETEQTVSIETGARTSISTGSTSAFEPVNKSQLKLSASTGTDTTSDKAAPSAATRMHVPNAPQRSQTDNTPGQDDNDVIDLTDSPPGSPRPPSPDLPNSVEQKANVSGQVVKQLPPSPPPVPKILSVIPEPFPDPRPYSKTRTVSFLADVHTPLISGSQPEFARVANQYSYDSGFHLDGSGACLEHKYYQEVQERLRTWEPYWRIVGDVGLRSVKASSTGLTWVGTRTTVCAATKTDPNVGSCAVLHLNLPEANKELFAGVRWGQFAKPGYTGARDQYKTGDTRLILRTLPLYRDKKDRKKRADTHIWPRGTLLQLGRGTSEVLIRIEQRKQESHDPSLWKGMSHLLDLTRYADPKQPMTVKLSCAEVVETIDSSKGSPMPTKHNLSGSYGLCAAICKYVGPDVLYDQMMGRISGGDFLIPTLSERSAIILAMDYVANQTVALGDSDDEGEGKACADESNSLTFSLVCPTSKTLIETPVRGRHCKHLQCFDLRNYLRINEPVYGGRWRCHACEEFVSVRDLVHCGLFQAMIDKFKDQISAARDKVTLHSDGSYHLNPENKLRYTTKKPDAAKASDAEVIDLD